LYLADSSFVFLDKSEVVSRASLVRGSYFESGSLPEKIIKIILHHLPTLTLYLKYVKRMMEILYPIIYHYRSNQKQLHLQENLLSMEGALPSIISSNLKGSGRATLLVKKQVVL
jgi:hypothetical protein